MRRTTAQAMLGFLLAAAGTGVAAAGQAAPPTPDAAAPVDGATVSAVWVEKDLAFTYMGFTTHYSCDGLQDKVRYVMKQLGARPDLKVTVNGCVNQTGPEIMPRARVRAALPREAVATDSAAARFPARWRTVTFDGSPMSDVQDGDCELMEQLVRAVLVPMGVRQVEGSSLNCVPHQLTLNAVNLRLQVLEAVKPPEAKR